MVFDQGLTINKVARHGDRIRLWGEFNNAWLSIFQKQKGYIGVWLAITTPQKPHTPGLYPKNGRRPD
jgi:hypothetical protein